ncbi:MAG: hypothetical protein JWR35_3695 [Marmoricola sp.]|nr:hypothetical protein [Marmoricola sp.]
MGILDNSLLQTRMHMARTGTRTMTMTTTTEANDDNKSDKNNQDNTTMPPTTPTTLWGNREPEPWRNSELEKTLMSEEGGCLVSTPTAMRIIMTMTTTTIGTSIPSVPKLMRSGKW